MPEDTLNLSENDVAYEEELLRDPFQLKTWLRYIQSKREAVPTVRYQLYERALKIMPGSYKLWYKYLSERRRDVKGCSPADPARKDVNNCFERSLVFMHKMPRIWTDYLEFLTEQRVITRTRRTFDAALQALPVTQHERIWPLYIKFIRGHDIPETAVRVYRRYVMLNRGAMEDYIDYLLVIKRFDDAAVKLVDIINDDRYVSSKEKTKHQMWVELAELIRKHATSVVSINVDAIIRSGIRKFTDMVGKLWNSLADYYIRRANFDKARDVYEEAIQTVLTVRDFSEVFDAYAQFEETALSTEVQSTLSAEEDEIDLELRVTRFERLMSRRAELLSSVILRQNPHNVDEWLKRALLFDNDLQKTIKTYAQGVRVIDPKIATGHPHKLWLAFAKLYETNGDITQARAVLDRAVEAPFKTIDDLATVWCEYAEMEIRCGQPKRALDLLHRATNQPSKPKNSVEDELPVQYRVFKSLKLWSLYVDLEESLGSFQSAKAAYDRILELKVATPQIVVNFAAFLEERHYFEEAFSVYERGVALFKWPIVFEIWNVYLLKFIQRYGKAKLERARELFEQAVDGCPAKFAKPLFLLYATFEEEHGLARHAMSVYERAANAVEQNQKLELWQLFIKRAATIFGVPYTRELFEKAIESLSDKDAAVICLQFADVERKLGEIDRARAVYAFSSQFCDPKVNKQFWETWSDFEVRHGNEDTFRDMMRIQNSVEASFKTNVNFAATIAAAQSVVDNKNAMAALEASKVEATKKTMQFVKAGGAEANRDEISLDDDEDDAPKVNLEEQNVPEAVFGGITAQTSLGAKARFQTKQ